MKNVLRTGRGLGYKSERAKRVLDSADSYHKVVRAIIENKIGESLKIKHHVVQLSTDKRLPSNRDEETPSAI